MTPHQGSGGPWQQSQAGERFFGCWGAGLSCLAAPQLLPSPCQDEGGDSIPLNTAVLPGGEVRAGGGSRSRSITFMEGDIPVSARGALELSVSSSDPVRAELLPPAWFGSALGQLRSPQIR